MSDAEFVQGVYVKVIETQYGEIIKQSFECEKFIEFMRANAKKGNNGKWYFNADILTAKEGGAKYMKVDTFEPKPQGEQAPMQQPQQQMQAPPMPAPQMPTQMDGDIPF
ncbi:MAG: hypothetical protein GY750_20815 [Lentisphaerae bacterium]|nr:hypothetical protein [Lentisphaerota bacterium]